MNKNIGEQPCVDLWGHRPTHLGDRLTHWVDNQSFSPQKGFITDRFHQLSEWLVSDNPAGVKEPDVKVLGWRGFIWSAVGRTAKFSTKFSTISHLHTWKSGILAHTPCHWCREYCIYRLKSIRNNVGFITPLVVDYQEESPDVYHTPNLLMCTQTKDGHYHLLGTTPNTTAASNGGGRRQVAC